MFIHMDVKGIPLLLPLCAKDDVFAIVRSFIRRLPSLFFFLSRPCSFFYPCDSYQKLDMCSYYG